MNFQTVFSVGLTHRYFTLLHIGCSFPSVFKLYRKNSLPHKSNILWQKIASNKVNDDPIDKSETPYESSSFPYKKLVKSWMQTLKVGRVDQLTNTQ